MIAPPPAQLAREEALPLLKALAEDTRFRCFETVRDADYPVSVAEVAAQIGLHANTVRPHLERLREVGLLRVAAPPRGTVGRPQHLYTVAPDGPALGLQSRQFHLLSEMLAALASRLSRPEEAVAVGREWGARLGLEDTPQEAAGVSDALDLMVVTFRRLGFDPLVDGDTLRFAGCPFREVAEAYPDLVCALHRGMCEGLADIADGATEVKSFHSVGSPDPCRARVSRRR